MLWLTRRGWMRRLQAGAFGMVPESRRERAFQNHLRQNRFARRYGLKIVRIVIFALLTSLAVTVVMSLVLQLIASEILVQPRLSDS
ncbi:hypothetical protein EON79_08095 [bacterium]|nr:MAG: hypothetical protein EON79_08095 [bacterium]